MRIRKRYLIGSAVLAAVVAISVAPAARALHEWKRRQKIQKLFYSKHAVEAFTVGPNPEGELITEDEEHERDDANLRAVANRTIAGDMTPAAHQKLMQIAQSERTRWASLMPGKPTATPVVGESWLPLGPVNAFFQYNGTLYPQVDSGRPTAIAVDPRDANVVYLATSGGGVWKTWDFETAAPNPTWHPITEALGNLAIGGLALDPSNPDVVIIATGDPYDVQGSSVFRSNDGGGTWSAPIALTGTYGGAQAVTATNVRELRIDPLDGQHVLIATNVGLFRSTDGAANFSLVDLPEAGHAGLAEAVWSIAYLGANGTKSAWAVAGVQACDVGEDPPGIASGVQAGEISPATGAVCKLGNKGQIWRSADGADSWTSIREAGGFPQIAVAGAGRMTLGAGKTTNLASTVLYAYVGSEDEGNSATVAFWRSMDGGKTFADATGKLVNPLNGGDCNDWPNLGHDQTWYNQALAVDPTNDDNVIAGGNLCGVRTTTGTQASPSWENVSHWLPSGGGAEVFNGTLPYVHADWHTALVSNASGVVRVYVGSDGGLFSSTNAFSAKPPQILWDFHNRGITSHLCYSIGSGDPATGNPYLALAGLQDNGTRYRDYSRWQANSTYAVGDTVGPITENGHLYRCTVAGKSDLAEPTWSASTGAQVPDGTVVWTEAGPTNSTTFNQVLGGDGIGAAVNKGTAGEWIWASVEFGTYFCRADKFDCNKGESWQGRDPPVPGGDGVPFLVRYSPVQTDPTGAGVLTISTYNVFKTVNQSCGGGVTGLCCPSNQPLPCWVRLGTLGTGIAARNVFASQTIPRLYGVAANQGRFAVTTNETTWTVSAPLSVGPNDSDKVYYTSSIAFPPVTPAGKADGDVFLGSSAALVDVAGNPVSDATGHLFKTVDHGQTWSPFHGNGTGKDLPNVPVMVVRYDPGDPTGSTIYVGTWFGVYKSADGGDTWDRFGYGLPLVRVDDLFISRTSSLLRIGTYGRGIWEIYPSGSAPAGVRGDGDFDRNSAIDWRDLGALSSRLGTTPATTGWPTYQWTVDLGSAPGTNGANQIDEGDLSALLSKFGDHP